jgi:hypothetical protein
VKTHDASWFAFWDEDQYEWVERVEETAVHVVVDPSFAVSGSSSFGSADGTSATSVSYPFAQPGDGGNEYWVMLIEKAWAQYVGSYDAANGSWLRQTGYWLTGKPPTVLHDTHSNVAAPPISDFATRVRNGAVIADTNGGLDEHPLFEDGTLVGAHAYYVTGVDEAAGTVTLQNPWGWNGTDENGNVVDTGITISYEDFQTVFQSSVDLK